MTDTRSMSNTTMPPRQVLEARWLELTRTLLPAVATSRGWPVRADHCFQRILLDNACHGLWYDRIAGRPAYAHADPALLRDAIALGDAALAGTADLATLNRRSLAWRRDKKASATRGAAEAFNGGRSKD